VSANRRELTGYASRSWAGWHGFAAVLLFVVGVFNIVNGLVAVAKDEIVLASGPQATVLLDVTAWGWVHVLLGVVIAIAGVAIFLGQTWGRLVGVLVVALNMVTQVMNVPAYPVWSLLVIALDVVIIWALTVHGDAMENA
jgi:hypothetical protein